MPRRRGARGFAQGIGEGLSDFSQILMQQGLLDRRAKDTRDIDLNRAKLDAQARVLSGEITPEQFEAMFGERLAEGSRPPVRRRLARIGEKIDTAPDLLSLPTNASILGDAAAENDVRNVPGLLDMVARSDGAFSLDEAMGEAPPEVRDLGARAGARRRQLRETPNVRLDTPDPKTGATTTGTFSLADLEQGVQTGLGAQDVGRLGGVQKRAEREFGVQPDEEGTDAAIRALSEFKTFTPKIRGRFAGEAEDAATQVAGPGRARQVGREASARANAELLAQFSPQAINARLAEAKAKAGIEMGMKEQAEFRKSFMQSQQAAAEFIPDFNELVATSEIVNNSEGLAEARRRGVMLRGASNAIGAQLLLGPGRVSQEEVEALTAMEQAKDRLLRRTVRAMGITEARVSDFEQELAARALAVDPGLNVTENRRALQNMRALTLTMPLVVQELGILDPQAPSSQIGQYANRAAEIAEELNQIEAQARNAGAEYFKAPAAFGSVILRVIP